MSTGFKWQRANEGERVLETTYKVTGLHGDTEYEFRVAAENKAGVGPYSETTLPLQVKEIVGKYWLVLSHKSCVLGLQYTCVTVGNAPELLSPLHDHTAIGGTTIKLECEISAGKPKAEIRWYVSLSLLT